MIPIAIDTETALACNREPVPRLVSVAFCDGEQARLFKGDDPHVFGIVRLALRVGAIFANAPFDIYVLLRAYPCLLPDVLDAYWNGRIFDVLTREKMIDISKGHRHRLYNLGSVAERRCGIEVDKSDTWRKRYIELQHVPIPRWPQAAKDYAIKDARATWMVWDEQEQERSIGLLDHWCRPVTDLFVNAPRIARAHLALHAQSLRGMYTDPQQVAKVDRDMTTEIEQLTMRLHRAGLVRIGGTRKRRAVVSNTKVARKILERDARGRLTTTSTGVSLSEDALRDANLPPGHILHAFRQRKSLVTLRTKTMPSLRHPWIRTRYDECKSTGRTGSSSPGDGTEADGFVGTNLQNQPKKGGFRECLVPPPGHLYGISDYTGAELITHAQDQLDKFGRSALADTLRRGINPHSLFAADMLRIDVGQVDHKNNPDHANARNGAKAWNFGKAGGMGENSFVIHAADVYEYEVTHDEYVIHDATWHRRFPEHRMSFNVARDLCRYGDATVVHHRSGHIRGGCSYTETCNTPFQEGAATAAKEVLWLLLVDSLVPSSPLFAGALLVDPATGRVPLTGQCLFVHDEDVTVLPCARARAGLQRQDEIMIRGFGSWTPGVPVHVESSIEERYKK